MAMVIRVSYWVLNLITLAIIIVSTGCRNDITTWESQTERSLKSRLLSLKLQEVLPGRLRMPHNADQAYFAAFRFL